MDCLTPAHQSEQALAQAKWDQNRAQTLWCIPRAVYATGAFRIYADGDLFRAQFRWWHPVTWLIWALLLPVAIIVSAFTSFTVISIVREFSWRPVKYLRDQPEPIYYVK